MRRISCSSRRAPKTFRWPMRAELRVFLRPLPTSTSATSSRYLKPSSSRASIRLAERSIAAVHSKGEGTIDGMIAMGQAYLAFALEETAVFRLMFGHNRAIKRAAEVEKTGRTCFRNVIEQVSIYCARNNAEGDAMHIALGLWTFVHGAACLLIDEDYENVAPGLDVQAMIATAATRLLPPPLERS